MCCRITSEPVEQKGRDIIVANSMNQFQMLTEERMNAYKTSAVPAIFHS